MLLIKKVNTDEELKRVLEIREQVFVKEQGVPANMEYDGNDNECTHYLVSKNNKFMGCARVRITDNGVKLERFAILKQYRNNGVGAKLLQFVLINLPSNNRIYLHAQTKAVNLYKKQGFKIVGESFLECNIEHYGMEKS